MVVTLRAVGSGWEADASKWVSAMQVLFDADLAKSEGEKEKKEEMDSLTDVS